MAGAAIAREVGDLAVGRGDAARVQRVARPARAGAVVRREDVELEALSAEAGHDLVTAVAIEVADRQRVAVDHLVLQYAPLPRLPFLGVDHHLIAMPRLDGG